MEKPYRKEVKDTNLRLRLLYPIVKTKVLTYIIQIPPTATFIIRGNASDTLMIKLQRFHNIYLRIASNAPWFIRNSQLHRELGVLHTEEQIKKIAKILQSISEKPKYWRLR